MGDPADEVAIIGAGPAGATLAALLAGRGIAVTLFDRDAFPRDKLCGEFLSYDALPVIDALGISLENAPRIERCRVIGARTYEFEFPHPSRGVSRLFFDDLLVRTAIARGAVLRTETVAELPNAKVIAGAWGRWGRFDRELSRSFVNVRDRNFGFKRHYTARTEGAVGRAQGAGETTSSSCPLPPVPCPPTTIDLYSFSRGYLGVNAIEGGLTNICGLVHASRLAGHKGRWDAFVDQLRADEPRLEALYSHYEPAQEQFLSSEPVIFRARSAVEGGVFMIGDASGIIDPLTGNGMAMAIQSALLAAPRILQLLEHPSRRAEIENDYREAHRNFFAPRIAWSRRVAALLSRPRLLDAALSAVRAKSIGTALMRRTRASREEVSQLAERWFC